MVASAVEGLTPEAVSIMDVHGSLLNRPRNPQDPSELSDEAIDYRTEVERDLLTKINSTLEPLLGAEKFRAGVSVDCDFTSGEQSEETYDPEKSVMTSSRRPKKRRPEQPRAESLDRLRICRDPPLEAEAVRAPRRSETIAFQTSKTVRRIKLPQGTVRRVSASVLVDQAVRWEGSGKQQRKVVTPPSAETVRAIRVLVSGAIGLQPDRGDQLVVESLPFESTLQAPAPIENTPVAAPSDPWKSLIEDPRYIGAAAGGLLFSIRARRL